MLTSQESRPVIIQGDSFVLAPFDISTGVIVFHTPLLGPFRQPWACQLPGLLHRRWLSDRGCQETVGKQIA